MKTTELLDMEKALQLIEHLLIRSGDEGEHLLPASLAKSGDGERSLAQRRQATRKSLSSARNLLAVAVQLMDEPADQSGKEAGLQMKSAIEKLKVAARGAYEAGHLLVGVKRESA